MVISQEYNFSNYEVNNFKFLTCNNLGYKLVSMNMADRIKQRMQELDINQDELGRQVGLTQPAIFKLLAGKTKRTTRLAEIAKALKARPEWLATGEEPVQGAITPDEWELLEGYRSMPPPEKAAALTLIGRASVHGTPGMVQGSGRIQTQYQGQDRRAG